MEDSLQHVTFLGEVLFDLDPGNVSGSETWYSLSSHDDNSGELLYPCRTRAPSKVNMATCQAYLHVGSGMTCMYMHIDPTIITLLQRCSLDDETSAEWKSLPRYQIASQLPVSTKLKGTS